MNDPLHDASVSSASAKLRDMIAEARSVVGFTGAGISTESGVPDFRSPDSPWMRHKPIPFDLFVASDVARHEAWRRKFAMDDLYREAGPNRGHRALASLVNAGKMPAVITQNIDGLHQASGVPADRVVELHGNGTYARCLDCGMRHELPTVRANFEQNGVAPVCDECRGLLKSATISFGQALPVDVIQKAQELAMTCDVFFVIGSSLVVYPAAALPMLAKKNGAKVIILNRQETPLDEIADLVIHAEIGPVLEPFAVA